MTQLHAPSRQKTTLLRFALLSLLMAPGVAMAQETPVAVPGAPAATASARAPVGVTPLNRAWIQPEREAPATVSPRNESRLAADISGTVLRWTADVGASVARGDVLVQIDPRDAQLAVQRAQAALDASSARLRLAQAQLKRAKDLVSEGFFSQEAQAQRETDVALQQSEVNSHRAQLATEQRQLAKTTLRAPFAGSVKERLAQTGETVAPGTVLYVLVESGNTEVDATLSPADVAGLRRAQSVRLETPAGSHALRLLRIGTTVSAPGRTQTARLAFVAPDQAPAAGSSGTLRWQESQPHLPPALLVRRGTALGVFVQQGAGNSATARFVPVPGAQEGRATPVPAGLAADTQLIVRGQSMLQNGQPIDAQATTN